jgi:hypothetical protein
MINAFSTIMGTPVHSSPMAVTRKWRVAKWPIKKRRRGWKVEAYETPAAFSMQDPMTGRQMLVAHPEIIAQMRRALPEFRA